MLTCPTGPALPVCSVCIIVSSLLTLIISLGEKCKLAVLCKPTLLTTFRENVVAHVSSIVEMALGVICGCMPYLAPLIRRIRQKSSSLSLKHLLSRLTPRLPRRSKQSSSGSNLHRISSHPSNDAYLETQILGSATGEGKFLRSGFHSQKSWAGRVTPTTQTLRTSTVREGFQD